MKRNIFAAVLTLCLFFVLGSLGHALQVEKGPYLIYPGDNTQMTVLWQLDATAACTLEWGLDTTYSTGSIQTAEYGSDHQHKYVISNLTPNARYYYRVTAAGGYHTGSFLTAPADTATNLKFLAYGDTRTYPNDHNSVCAQMVNTFTNDPDYQTFTVHVGDWVNDGDLENDWTNEYFDRSQPDALEMMANLPVMGCMGNHEYSGNLYQKYLPYNFVANRYFSYDYGPVHIIILDQYVSYAPGSAQYNWLENDLATTTRPWKFIVLHEPGWSAGGHSNEPDVQNYIQPLCLSYGVDMVFAGHNHYYAHCDAQGVHHMTVGGGGAPLYSPSSSAENLVYADMVLHHGEIDIQGEMLYFTARDSNGAVIESFTVSHVYVPQLPWSDGFESGDFVTGGWTISGGQVSIGSDAYSGSFGASIGRVNWLEKAVSTEGFNGITVKYARKTLDLDAGEFLVVEWSDGFNWHELERTQDTAWTLKQFNLPAGADDTKAFKLRFRNEGVDNKEYTYVDAVEVFSGGGTPDTDPPSPDPMTWATVPYATGSASISMTAATASDPSGVEYYFECVSGGGNDSGWQDSTTYEDTGLTPDTTYTYRVKARDKSSNLNETAYSGNASATTQSSGGTEIYVNDIAMSYTAKSVFYTGVAVVWIKDTTGADVEGATVYGTWSGAVNGTDSGVTGADGKITFTSPKVKYGGTFTFTVTNVVKSGATYNSSLNNEASDSIITP